MNSAIADGLNSLDEWNIVSATFADPEQGLSEAALDQLDVLIWWGKWHHKEVEEKRVEQIARRVKDGGMGLIVLHSGHAGKPFQRVLGAKCLWKSGAVDDSPVKVIVKDSGHPIARGIKDFVIAKSERYSEPFDVPQPQSVVFDGVFTRPDGTTEASRQGLTWQIGKGRVFYFQPGHETYPNFLQAEVLQILRNAVQWAAQ
jgi:trehalose utilization protein